MPVTCKLKSGKWRVVESDGTIAKNKKGTAVDGGGHDTKEQCRKQAKAINANSEEMIMAENKNTAPKSACIFEQECCEVKFADDDKEQVADDRFSIVAYSGGIISNHWFWGNVAFDLAGMRFDKKKTPVLEEHFSVNRIGYTTKQEIESNVRVEGRFLPNPRAQEMRADIKAGFPMQASLFIPPETIEHIKEGEETEVNGHTLKGPGTVFRKAIIKEVSMCSLGSDSHTQVKAFADGGKEKITFNFLGKEIEMADVKKIEELDAKTFAAEYPEIHNQITETAKAEGKEAERVRFREITEVCGDDHDLAAKLFTDGADKAAALTAKNTKLTEQNKKLSDTLAEAAKKKVDPALAEFSDDASKSKAKEPAKAKTPDEKYTDEFNADQKIQAEFGGAAGLKDYIAFRKNEDKGLVKIISKR